MVRSFALAIVVLSSSQAAAADLPPVYVAPGGIYAPSAHIYVDSGAGYRDPPDVGHSHAYGQPSYPIPGPVYGSPASVYGETGPVYEAPPVYIQREPAYVSPDYGTEIAPRPPLAVPYGRGRCVVNPGYGRRAYCD